MKSSDILLTLNEPLKVWKVAKYVCVSYDEGWIDDGVALCGTFGTGQDFEAACDNYLARIRGKRLVFEGLMHTNRKEVQVLEI